jgi:hypothetical protein
VKKNIPIIIAALLFSFILWGSISLSKDYFVTIDIPIKIINFPDGYTTGTQLPEKVTMKIRGNGWELIGVNLSSESQYLISAGWESGKKYVNLYNFLTDNQWLSSDMEVIDISPDTLSFLVEKITEKKVRIEPDLDLSFKPGYGLASKIEIYPESTNVLGAVSVLNNLNSVQTEKAEFSDLNSRIIEILNLQENLGMTYEVNSVTATIDVQKIVDKNFDNLLVEIHDIPADRDVVLLPNRISVGIRGGIDILGKLTPDQFKAYVYYRDVVLDTLGSIKPRIIIPENTTFLYMKPERLRYIIKKFK